MSTRRRISASERAEIFRDAGGLCHICGLKIDGKAWDVEHVIPLAMGGDEARGSDNLKPAHASCHRAKTAEDAGHIAKAARMQQRGMGIGRQARQKIPGSRGTGLRRKVDGTVVRVDE